MGEIKSFSDQHTALVTGASGHLGFAICEQLSDAGFALVLVGRSKSKLESLRVHLESRGRKAMWADADLTSHQEVKSLFETIESSGVTHLEAVVNNAHSMKLSSDPDDYALNYESSFATALSAIEWVASGARTLLRTGKKENGLASIVNIASMYGEVAPDFSVYPPNVEINRTWYGASKAALIQLSRYMASDFGREGIRVNSISPGAFPSERVAESSPEFIERLGRKSILGRVGKPAELADVCVFLCSDKSNYITGANIPVDGGWTTW